MKQYAGGGPTNINTTVVNRLLNQGYAHGGNVVPLQQGGEVPAGSGTLPPLSPDPDKADTVPARLTENEFVISAEVAKAIGLDTLNNFHEIAKDQLSTGKGIGKLAHGIEKLTQSIIKEQEKAAEARAQQEQQAQAQQASTTSPQVAPPAPQPVPEQPASTGLLAQPQGTGPMDRPQPGNPRSLLS